MKITYYKEYEISWLVAASTKGREGAYVRWEIKFQMASRIRKDPIFSVYRGVEIKIAFLFSRVLTYTLTKNKLTNKQNKQTGLCLS